jgi:hypothetical protein
MNDEKSQQRSWYLQTNGRVIGPFPSAAVRRMLSLGQAGLDDLVSSDRRQWKAVRQVHEVVPPELRGAKQAWQTPEPARKPLPLVAMAVFALVFSGIIGFALWWGGSVSNGQPDCAAAPRPAVDWRNCRLLGLSAEWAELQRMNGQNAVLRAARLNAADLSFAMLDYADLSSADLAYTLLHGASLRGADLRGADLTNSDLSQSDLSFADLRGARLGAALLQGASLHNALWFDGRICAKDSLGACAAAP